MGSGRPEFPDALRRLFPPPAGRSFDVVLWDGTLLDPPGGPAPRNRLFLKDKKVFKRIALSQNAYTAGKAYVEGSVDVEGSAADILRELFAHRPLSRLSAFQKLHLLLTVICL